MSRQTVALSFSGEQLELVQGAARYVQPAWRGRFLEALTDVLLPHANAGEVEDHVLLEACIDVLARMGVPRENVV